MTNIKSNEELGQRIEQLIQEHIAASRMCAQEAVARAFASAASVPTAGPARGVRSSDSRGKKRASADIAVLGERFYRAVSAKPGATMAERSALLPSMTNRP